MKASAIRKLAKAHDMAALEAAAESISEREEDPIGIDGADLGEKLTHVMLAMRVVKRVDGGEDFREAFRAEMDSVRALLTNED